MKSSSALSSRKPVAEVLRWLATQGVIIAAKTLQRRRVEWGVSRKAAPPSAELVAQIDTEFHTTTADDQTIARTLNTRGFATTPRQVQTIRLANSWRRRADTDEQIMEQRQETFARVEQALAEGTTRSYGREFMHTNLRVQHGYRARQDDIRDALAIYDPQGTAARKPGLKRKRRGEFIVPGPDWLWSIDGHDKFRNYGIEIYGAIDAYSRRVIWIYVGNSNRTQVSVARQYLSALRRYNRCPAFFRSDRGKEVLMLADAHYSFYTEYKRGEGATEEELETLPLRGCYMFGTSTANIKIESFWRRLIGTQTAPWIVSYRKV